jgi:hypothetical protein
MKLEFQVVERMKRTYSLLNELSHINGANVSGELLDRMMYSFEALPLLGKEYWWFLFFGWDGRQMMLLVFRKSGTSMIFNGEKVVLKETNQSSFQAVTTGWIYDGKRMRDLGVTNPVVLVNAKEKVLASKISDRKMVFRGNFPEYELMLGEIAHMKMTRGDFLENRRAHGILVPPFGAGWTDVYSSVRGNLLGKVFEGTAHLQKVVGVVPYGSFHWARVVFQSNSTFSFFCLKSLKESKKYFNRSMDFYDHRTKRYFRFKNPKLVVSERRGKTPTWTVEGKDGTNELRVVLRIYAEKQFTMNGGGSQVYEEYAVTPSEFAFRNKEEVTTLQDLGKGIGTFENAHGSPIL